MTKMKYVQPIKSMLISFLFALPMISVAQVTINAQLPAGGMMQKDQLWNLTLLSNQATILEVTIKLSLQDAITSQELLSASTGSILLGQGIKLLTNQMAQPILYNYTSTEFSGIFLPIGNYIACYQVIGIYGERQVVLASECSRFKIDPLSPPLLSLPADKSEVNMPYPFFVWMPPTPIDMFSNLTYDLIITEVTERQSPAEAIENNIPVYTNTNLSQSSLSYPGSFFSLDTAKTYAWQVVAKNGSSYAGKTEVWTFSITGAVTNPVATENYNYLLLENDLKGIYFISGSGLHIKYTSYEMGHDAPINFLDGDGKIVETINKYIIPGDNYIDLPLSRKLHKETVYRVAITDISGKSHFISISISK